MSYCEFTKDLDEKHLDKLYHDKRYGFPTKNDDELFGRLIMEINQAGLSWSLILKKEAAFYEAFNHFSIAKVAKYSDEKIAELLQNKAIIRNRRKIEATIFNAHKILEIQAKFGTFHNWLKHYVGYSLDEWTNLFKKTFKFTGKLIVEEFLMSTSYIEGAHTKDCPIYKNIIKSKPEWERK